MSNHNACTLSGPVVEPGTHAEGEHLLVRYASRENRDGWNNVTDETIIEWGCRYAGVKDDDLEWPTRDVLAAAYELARKLQEANVPVPSNIVPNGEGGIVFEWRHGPILRVIEGDKDGSFEFLEFRQSRLVIREPLALT